MLVTANRRVRLLQQISEGGYKVVNGPFELGEVSFHSGWTFHRADGNATSVPREIFTVIYIDRVRTCIVAADGTQRRSCRDHCCRAPTDKRALRRTYAWSSRSTQTSRLTRSDGSPTSSQGKHVLHTGILLCGLLTALLEVNVSA